jgi:two-component system, response regulator YesN
MEEQTLPGASNRVDGRQAPPDPYPTFEFRGRNKGLQRLSRWIALHSALRLTLKEAAAIACLEPHYFSRAFHRHVGETFLEWRLRYRVAYAIDAIENGRVPINRIPELVGYHNRRSIERVVKRVTGVTPAVLQRSPGKGASGLASKIPKG